MAEEVNKKTPDIQEIMQGLQGIFEKKSGYTRPANGLEYPKVWMRFEGKKPDASGKIPKFRIEDATEEWWDQIFEYSSKFREEEMTSVGLIAVTTRTSATLIDKESQLSVDIIAISPDGIKEYWGSMLKDRVSFVCLTDDENPPRLAGFNVNEVSSEPKTVMKETYGSTMLILGNVLAELKNSWSVFDHWGVDKYVDAMGLFVVPEFRGQGISPKLLEARIPLCKAIGIKATANTFSSKIARIAAKKVGFKDLARITVQELHERYGLKLEGQEGESIVFMGMRIE